MIVSHGCRHAPELFVRNCDACARRWRQWQQWQDHQPCRNVVETGRDNARPCVASISTAFRHVPSNHDRSLDVAVASMQSRSTVRREARAVRWPRGIKNYCNH
jgi:hypothetical protein